MNYTHLAWVFKASLWVLLRSYVPGMPISWPCGLASLFPTSLPLLMLFSCLEFLSSSSPCVETLLILQGPIKCHLLHTTFPYLFIWTESLLPLLLWPIASLHCEYTGLGFILTPQAPPLGNCGSLRAGNTRLTHIRAGNKTYLRISMLLSWIYVKIIETILEGPSGVVCSKSFILKQRKLRLRLGNYIFSNPIFLENLRDWNKRLQCSINSWGPISF